MSTPNRNILPYRNRYHVVMLPDLQINANVYSRVNVNSGHARLFYNDHISSSRSNSSYNRNFSLI